MMTLKLYSAVSCILCGVAATAMGGSFPGTMSRETLASSSSMDSFSVGAGLEAIRRDIDFSKGQGNGTLDVLTGYFIAGYDILDWLTLYGTIGGSSVELMGNGGLKMSDYDESTFKWSIGLNGNLWHFDVRDPHFMAGRLSLRTLAEVEQHFAEDDREKIYWTDVSISLPAGYEVFVDHTPFTPDGVYSLLVYFGPGVSLLNGRTESAGLDCSFDADREFTVFAGFDLYVAENLCFGCSAQYVGDTRWGASLRYHF